MSNRLVFFLVCVSLLLLLFEKIKILEFIWKLTQTARTAELESRYLCGIFSDKIAGKRWGCEQVHH